MRRLIRGFAGRTYHIVGNLMQWLSFNSLPTSVVCWQPLQTVWTLIRTDEMSVLIWIQIVWHSDGNPEWIFRKKLILKKNQQTLKKSMKNDWACKDLKGPSHSQHCLWQKHQTTCRTRSRWGAIANPHSQVFNPPEPQSPIHSWGMTQVIERKFLSICFMPFICENTNKVWYKNLWNWLWKWNMSWYLTFWPHPKVTSLTLGWKFYLHSVLLIIPINLKCHMIMFEKKCFWPLLAPPGPPSPTPGAWLWRQNKNPILYVSYLLNVGTYTKFGIKIFEIDI